MFLRISSSYFVAGIEVGKRAAPIIKYMKDWDVDRITSYCNKKNWKVEVLSASINSDAAGF